MAYFITDDNSTKGRDPNINIINGIHKIKEKTSVNILVSNYTNDHITFNKGEYIGCLEPAITDDMTIDDSETHSMHSITLQKVIAEQLQPAIFDPPHNKLEPGFQSKLDTLLKEYETQFAKDETSIRTTPLTEMTIDTGDSDPISQKPYPITMKNYQWVKEEIEKLRTAKVIHSSRSSWSAPIIVVAKGDRGKQLIIDYKALNKATRKFTWPMPKVGDIFSKLNGAKYFFNSGFQSWLSSYYFGQVFDTKNSIQFPFWQPCICQGTFRISSGSSIFSRINDQNIKGFQLFDSIPR